jgi:hypothetical protein
MLKSLGSSEFQNNQVFSGLFVESPSVLLVHSLFNLEYSFALLQISRPQFKWQLNMSHFLTPLTRRQFISALFLYSFTYLLIYSLNLFANIYRNL